MKNQTSRINLKSILRAVTIFLLCLISILQICVNVKASSTLSSIIGNRDWKWPVPSSKNISSCFPNNCGHGSVHHALDISGSYGSPIYATYEGTVLLASSPCNKNFGKSNGICTCGKGSSCLGNYVYILHNYKGMQFVSRYGHMQKVNVSTGQTVTKNTIIGEVGSTGASTGPHLDYTIWQGNSVSKPSASSSQWIDPFLNQFLEKVDNLTSEGCNDGYVNEVNKLYSNLDPLTISNVKVLNITSDSYTVSCNITGNVTRALFPTWPSADDSGNPIWHEGTISGNTASCVIKKSDHGNKSGDYITHIYIYDSAGNSTAGAAPLVVMGDTQAPVISDIRISEIKMDSYTIVCKVYDNGGVTSVKFPTWPSADDSGEPIWHEGTINGDTASCVIKKSDHGNKTGLYLTHIYAYDMNGNMTAGRAPGVIIGDTEPPVIENIKITNVTEESYTITCTVKDNNTNGTITVRFPTWPSADDSGEPIWHEGTVNGDTASCTIRTSDHGNKTGTYISHIYAYDAVGNSSAAAAPAVELGKKHQHDYEVSIKKPATCTESGIMLYTCKDNDDSYEEEIPATGHQHTELRNVSEATCAQEGYTGDTYCKDCGIKLSSGTVIPKTGHTWDAGKIMKAATDTESGIKTYTCTKCNTTRTEEIPATGEHPNIEIRGAKSATCLEEGYTGDTYCKDCGIKLSSGTVIPSTGHGTKITKFAKEATYTQEGYSGDIYCQDCGVLLEEGRVLAKLEQPKQKAIPGEVINDKASNGVYKVLADGRSVVFVKQIVQSKAVKIPDTISINGTVYAVTGISANAFKNNQLLKTAVIGSNVRKIGKQAFYNCKSLKTITIRTSMLTKKNVGAKAFKGTYKKIKVKVPAKQFKTYKKLFKSKGMSKKAIYKK